VGRLACAVRGDPSSRRALTGYPGRLCSPLPAGAERPFLPYRDVGGIVNRIEQELPGEVGVMAGTGRTVDLARGSQMGGIGRDGGGLKVAHL